MEGTTHRRPAFIAIVSLTLQGGLGCFGVFLFFTEPGEQEIWFLVSMVLFVGFITIVRQRVTLFEDRIEYRGLWDGGELRRNEVRAIHGVFRTRVVMHDRHVYRLPYIRRLTPRLRAWFADVGEQNV